jgi:hypothetical protein
MRSHLNSEGFRERQFDVPLLPTVRTGMKAKHLALELALGLFPME